MTDEGSPPDPERFAALLDAVVAIGSDLDINSVLGKIVDAACQITGAGKGYLGILDRDGDVAEVVLRATGGRPSTTIPQLNGPQLRVPVLVQGRDYARLMLAGKRHEHDFTETDESMVAALARAAAYVIENAQSLAESERRQLRLEASLRITEALHSSVPLDQTLAAISAGVRAMADAGAVAVLEREVDDILEVTAFDATATAASEARDLMDQVAVMLSARGLPEQRVSEVTVDAGTAVVAPMYSQGSQQGVLAVWFEEERFFADIDLELYAAFADQASLALDRAQAIADREELRLIADRDRIARDLHDVVIQRLFATGLQLQGLARGEIPDAVRERLEATVVDIDDTIRDIRTTIFELQHVRGGSLRADVRGLAKEYAGVLGFAPHVRIDGPIDSVVDNATGEQLLATLREALSNVAKHSKADACHIEVDVNAERLRLRVIDNGVGLPDELPHQSGLRNVRYRAGDLGGEFELTPTVPSGTTMTWVVPL